MAAKKTKQTSKKTKKKSAQPKAAKAKAKAGKKKSARASTKKVKTQKTQKKPAKKAAARKRKQQPKARGTFHVLGSAWSKDGKRLALSTAGRIDVWDTALVRQGQRPALVQRVRDVEAADRIALSRSGARLVAARHGFPEVRLFDLQKKAALWEVDVDDAVTSVSFAPDGGRVLIGAATLTDAGKRGRAVSLDAKDGSELWRSPDVERGLRHVAFSPDGLLVLGVLEQDGVVVVWDGEASRELFRFPEQPHSAAATALSADGKLAAIAVGDAVEVWRTDSGERAASIPIGGRTRSVAISPDGRLLITGAPTAGRWTLPSGARAGALDGDGTVALSPDGELVFSSSTFVEVDGPALQTAAR